MRFSTLLFLAACSSSPHTFAQVQAAIASPTGSVDATTAPAFILDNETRNALMGAAGTLYANTPVGFRRDDDAGQQIYDNACQGLSKDGAENVRTVSLSNSTDGGATGTIIVSLACKSDNSFALNLAFKSACTQTLCFNGELLAQYTETSFVWALRADTEPPGGGPGGVADMGGTATIDSSGYDNDQVVAWFGKKPAPILLTWSLDAGINQYSDFSLKGATAYACHATGNSGTCDPLDASGNSSDVGQIKW